MVKPSYMFPRNNSYLEFIHKTVKKPKEIIQTNKNTTSTLMKIPTDYSHRLITGQNENLH